MGQDPGAHSQWLIHTQRAGQGISLKGEILYFSCRREKENFFWGSAMNEEQQSGKYKFPKIKGKVFPWALGFLTQMKTRLCWAKSWAKPYKNAKIHRTVANCSVPLSLPGCPDSLQAQHWIFLLLSQALCYSPSSLKPCAPGLCYSYLFLNEFPAHRLQSEISKCKWLKAQTTEGK